MSVIFLQNSLANTTHHMQNVVVATAVVFSEKAHADRDCRVKTLRNLNNKRSLLDWQNHHEHKNEFCRFREGEVSNGTRDYQPV
jgi:hypothetical protein